MIQRVGHVAHELTVDGIHVGRHIQSLADGADTQIGHLGDEARGAGIGTQGINERLFVVHHQIIDLDKLSPFSKAQPMTKH